MPDTGAIRNIGGVKDLISTREAAAILSVSHTTIIRAIKAEKLPAWRVGHNFKIERAAVEAYAKPVGLR